MVVAVSVDRLLGGMPRRTFIDALGDELGVAATTLAPTVAVAARRAGVVADTHCQAADATDLPDAVPVTFARCDVVLHCGDLSTCDVLDRLASVAPVVAVRSLSDPVADAARLFDGPLLVRAGETLIGVVSDLPDIDDPGAVFGTEVDVVVSGTTHVPVVRRAGPTLVVNPGSPTLPAAGSPTVAVFDLAGPATTVNLVHLPWRS
jgi:putative phosphoesterase